MGIKGRRLSNNMILFQNAHHKLLAKSIMGSEINREASPKSPFEGKIPVKYESSNDEDSEEVKENVKAFNSDSSEEQDQNLNLLNAKIASAQQMIEE